MLGWIYTCIAHNAIISVFTAQKFSILKQWLRENENKSTLAISVKFTSSIKRLFNATSNSDNILRNTLFPPQDDMIYYKNIDIWNVQKQTTTVSFLYRCCKKSMNTMALNCECSSLPKNIPLHDQFLIEIFTWLLAPMSVSSLCKKLPLFALKLTHIQSIYSLPLALSGKQNGCQNCKLRLLVHAMTSQHWPTSISSDVVHRGDNL